MSRKSFVYCEIRKKLVPKEEFFTEEVGRAPMIMPDLPDILSSVDGKVIHGRAGMRVHNKMHNVTFTEDFKDTWASAARERERFFEGKTDKKARGLAVAESYERVRAGYRPHRGENQ